MELKPLTIKIRKDVWLKWKILSAKEETTMSEIAEKLVSEYARRKGVK